ncbi:MAG: hypothetical protein BWK76_18190 [Desulfobulbaceae bacterium A2]|nr:MAG: hypothetical protein BWK76_18190 [Desulfobulbaceae bacterium A2]
METQGHDKFAQVPKDEDTRILRQHRVLVDEREALFQQWAWECITGNTLIFATEDVADLTDADLLALPGRVFGPQSGSDKGTLKRQEHYVFVNFGFEY